MLIGRTAMATYLCSFGELRRYFVLTSFLITRAVNGQQGFVSIDCGMFSNDSYTDNTTGIVYKPDMHYVDTGANHKVAQDYLANWWPQIEDLRSFPSGKINCYTISNIDRGAKYLVRALFLYGNYDGLQSASTNSPLRFNIYLGVNLWKEVVISSPDGVYQGEIIAISQSDYLSVCLENTGLGVPFISALELRHIDSPEMYQDVNQSVSLSLVRFRENLGARESKNNFTRYPNDPYDRIWWPAIAEGCIPISSNGNIVQMNAGDQFQVPSVVMGTAATPNSSTTSALELALTSEGDILPTYYVFMHFAELDTVSSSQSRIMDVYVNSVLKISNFSAEYLLTSHIILTDDLGAAVSYNLTIASSSSSTLPPILNALEAHSGVPLQYTATDRGDIGCLLELKGLYRMNIWQGDPCKFGWDGVNCTVSGSSPPRVTTLNLSSLGLTGGIPTALAKLHSLQYLDLSNNKFSGSIPSFLAHLHYLVMLNLSGNQLTGSVPDDLLRKQSKGLLDLIVSNNTNLCAPGNICSAPPRPNRTTAMHVIIIATVIPTVLIIVIIVFVVFLLWRRNNPTKNSRIQPQALEVQEYKMGDKPLIKFEFAFKELQTITSNFERLIGRGGFGTVYYGRLEDGTEVAVKTRHDTPIQGTSSETMARKAELKEHAEKQFQAEALLLSRIHHRNLLSLIGFCKDSNCLALIYEYMPQGSVKDHLSEKADDGKFLSWKQRIQIAIDTAQGLEYLHKGCTPSVVHRDVKTCNILLSNNFEAKIADFGLSRAFLTDSHTHLSTVAVAGTPGYIDPEHYNTFQLTEKSDMYSFGVVLLELVTGLPAILTSPERVHIAQWAQSRLSEGDVAEIVDAKLGEDYDINSVGEVVELAMNCMLPTGGQRPNTSEVVVRLKELQHLEAASGKDPSAYNTCQGDSI